MDVVLFDDRVAAEWMPFALTRPASELLFGARTMRQRAAEIFGRCVAVVAPERLRGFAEGDTPPVLALDETADRGQRLFLSSRAVVDSTSVLPPDRAGVVTVGGAVAGCFVSGGSPPRELLADPGSYDPGRPLPGGDGTVHELPGRMLDEVWDLISGNADQLERDLASRRAAAPGRARVLPAGVHLIGPTDRLLVEEGVAIEPGVVLDTSAGSIWLDRGVRVHAFTRLQGPAYVGPDSVLLGGPFSAISVGPRCKIHGEVEETVVLGYSNKAHDGFLGHAYLGRWVNLGALTTNSDLKNNYGTIRLWTPLGERDTGSVKMGCLLGDHVKTGIGVMLNTGTVIGAGSNVFGAAQPPKFVPPFSWGSGERLTAYDLDRFLATARVVMSRRDVELTASTVDVLRRAYAETRA